MNDAEDDPVYRHALRESLVAICAWVVCGVYTISFCYLNGYGLEGEEVETVWGIPSWVFYGVFLPWTLCNVFALWYCFWFTQDDDLGETPSAEREDSTPRES